MTRSILIYGMRYNTSYFNILLDKTLKDELKMFVAYKKDTYDIIAVNNNEFRCFIFWRCLYL